MGLATVRRFVAEGASVVVADLNVAAGERVAAELGHAVRFERCDVSVEADVAAAVRAAVDSFGRARHHVQQRRCGWSIRAHYRDRVRRLGHNLRCVLVRGVFTGTKHAARQMIEQGAGGSIINTASVAGLGGGGGPQAYSAAKAAVINLTETTANELACALDPGQCDLPGHHLHAADASRRRG